MKYLFLLLSLVSFSAQAYMPTESQRKAFYEAYKSGNSEYMIEKLLDGYNPNDSYYGYEGKKGGNYVVALSGGVSRHDPDFLAYLKVLRLFLEMGADIEATSENGNFPVYNVEEIEIANILREFGADFTRVYRNHEFGVTQTPEVYIRNHKVLEIAFKQGVVPTCEEANYRWSRGNIIEVREIRELYSRYFMLHFGKTKEDLCDANDDWGFDWD